MDEKYNYPELLYKLYYELHPTYSSTTGPHGGIGGQAMTQWCHVTQPYSIEHEKLISEIDGAISAWIRNKE